MGGPGGQRREVRSKSKRGRATQRPRPPPAHTSHDARGHGRGGGQWRAGRAHCTRPAGMTPRHRSSPPPADHGQGTASLERQDAAGTSSACASLRRCPLPALPARHPAAQAPPGQPGPGRDARDTHVSAPATAPAKPSAEPPLGCARGLRLPKPSSHVHCRGRTRYLRLELRRGWPWHALRLFVHGPRGRRVSTLQEREGGGE